MKTDTKAVEKKNLDSPDEQHSFPKGKVELVTVKGITFERVTLEPGWKWSESVKPMAGTKSCEAPHTQYYISGTLRVRMDDGTEHEFGPGDASFLPAGHDAWVVGNDRVVFIDVEGNTDYGEGK